MMKSSVLRLSLAFVALTAFGCTKTTSPKNASRRGESCASRNDCASGLTCVSNVCVYNELPISPTANICVLVECSTATDCPTYPPTYVNFGAPYYYSRLDRTCPTAQSDCTASGGTGTACTQFDTYCKPWSAVCTADQKCDQHFTCASDTDCSSNPIAPGNFCASGSCVECATASDCGGGACIGGACVECATDSDCATNEYCDTDYTCTPRCIDDSTCGSLLNRDTIYVCNTTSGRCEATPCTDDRQCQVLLQTASGTCMSGQCGIPCQSDAECRPVSTTATGYQFERCLSGVCTYVGCATDLECAIELHSAIVANGGGKAVCEPKPTN